jgi:cysteine desulfurase
VARHYLDHASTSPPRPEVIAAMADWWSRPVGDPGRVHEEGRVARDVVETARDHVAGLLGVRPRQVVFTSGGTEAVNAAVWGATRARPGAVVLCAAVEHSSVRESSARLAPVERLPVDRVGRIDVGALSEALARHAADPPALVHCQWANHEVGTIQDTAAVAALCRTAGVPLHVDAAAAFGQVELGLAEIGADLVSVTAHKAGGPPGVGALLVRRGARLEPLVLGGQQERARRGGLENVPAIAGFGTLAALLADGGGTRLRAECEAARRRTGLLADAATSVAGVIRLGDPDPSGRLPNLVCLGVEGVEAEAVLLGLDRAGVAAHSGSACSSESFEPSPVLEAMGADPSHSLRLTVGWSTEDADVAAFGAAFPGVVGGLRALRA